MKETERNSNKLGFTLLELLVVVLIIGILAGIALPQYRLAVDKTKMTQLITFSSSVKQAQQRYYLVKGSYAKNWNDIDISLEGYTADGEILWKRNMKSAYAILNYQGTGLYFHGGSNYLPGILLITFNAINQRSCYADKENERAQALCKHVCNKKNLGTDEIWKTCNF